MKVLESLLRDNLTENYDEKGYVANKIETHSFSDPTGVLDTIMSGD